MNLTKLLENPKLFILSEKIPEIEALIGRIQPPQYHPEGDAYVHTMEVCQRAKELGGNLDVLFACLVHDVGKAVTPNNELPHHYNHEKLGVPIVKNMCQRLGIEGYTLELALRVTEYHLRCHRYCDMRPHKRVDLLDDIKGYEDDFTLACQADAQGRGPESRNTIYLSREVILQDAALLREAKFPDNLSPQKLRDGKARLIKENEKKFLDEWWHSLPTTRDLPMSNWTKE